MGDEVIRLVKKIIGVEPFVDRRRKDNYFTVRSAKRQTRTFFEHYGFTPGRRAATVKIPSDVMRSTDPRVWVGFLRGAFSSDGSFWYRGKWGQCRFEVASQPLRDGFIQLAERLEYRFRGYSYIHKGGHNKLPLHLAYLGTRNEVRRWMEEVGSMSDTHARRYREWLAAIDPRKTQQHVESLFRAETSEERCGGC